MSLQSALFQNDPKLDACLNSDFAQILPDHQGDFVRKLQRALQELDQAPIAPFELANGRYGPTTTRAVLAFKRKRGQLRVTNVVCRWTIAVMDRELAAREVTAA